MAAVLRVPVGSSRYSHGITSGVSPLLPSELYAERLDVPPHIIEIADPDKAPEDGAGD
jgi:hypothetical protein